MLAVKFGSLDSVLMFTYALFFVVPVYLLVNYYLFDQFMHLPCYYDVMNILENLCF
jgi:hypothetical protein